MLGRDIANKNISNQIVNSDNELINQVLKLRHSLGEQAEVLAKFKDINIRDKRGFTILHYASISGDAVLVSLLVEKFYAKVDEVGLDKQTALHLAINNGHTQIAKYLVGRGADIFARSSTGQNVLHYAAHHGDKEFIIWLFEQYLKPYLKQQLLGSKDDDGKNALHYAALSSVSNIINILCQNELNVNERNKYGYTALHFAASRNADLEVLSLLVKFGGNIEILNVNAETPLMLATKFDNQIAIEYLEELDFNRYAHRLDSQVKCYIEAGIKALYKVRGEGKGLELYNKALREAIDKQDYIGACYVLSKLGDFYLNKNNYSQAAKMYNTGYNLSLGHELVARVFNEEYFYNKQLRVEVRFIREACADRDSTVAINFVNHKTKLLHLRNEMNNAQGQGVQQLLLHSTKTTKGILLELLESVLKSIKPVNCQYAFLGLEELAEDILTLDGKIKLAILVDHSNSHIQNYFEKVIRLLQLKIISISENKLALSTSQAQVVECGLSLDESIIIKQVKLASTPKELAKCQQLKEFKQDMVTADMLRHSCFLKGNEGLFNEYELLTQKILSKGKSIIKYMAGLKVGQEQALALMGFYAAELKSHLEQIPRHFHEIRQVSSLLKSIISSVGLYYDIREQNVWAILDSLEKLKALGSLEVERIKKVIEAFVFSIRGNELEASLIESCRIILPLCVAIEKFDKSKGKYDLSKTHFYEQQPSLEEKITKTFIPKMVTSIIEEPKVEEVEQGNNEDTLAWYFDSAIRKVGLEKNEVYKLISASSKDKQKVVACYQHRPVPGYEVGSVQVIYNPSMNRKFALYIDELQQRGNNAAFKPSWVDEDADSDKSRWRIQVYRLFETMTDPYKDKKCPLVKLLPLWHGTSSSIIDSILRAGYANLATTDSGFFGKGIYSTHEAEYAHRVYSKGALLLNWVACFSAYPVIYGDMDKLQGKGNYINYDGHFIPVAPRTPEPNETVYHPTAPNQAHTYIELVVFQTAACLPRYLVNLQPILVKALGTRQSDNPINPQSIEIKGCLGVLLNMIVPLSQMQRTVDWRNKVFTENNMLLRICEFFIDKESPIVLKGKLPDLIKEFVSKRVVGAAEQKQMIGL